MGKLKIWVPHIFLSLSQYRLYIFQTRITKVKPGWAQFNLICRYFVSFTKIKSMNLHWKKNKTEEEMSLTLKGFDFAFYCILLYFILLHYLMYHKITNIDSSSNNTDYYKFYSFPLSSFMPTFLYHIQLMCFFFTMPLYFF